MEEHRNESHCYNSTAVLQYRGKWALVSMYQSKELEGMHLVVIKQSDHKP